MNTEVSAEPVTKNSSEIVQKHFGRLNVGAYIYVPMEEDYWWTKD